jgi:hypothetical protein
VQAQQLLQKVDEVRSQAASLQQQQEMQVRTKYVCAQAITHTHTHTRTHTHTHTRTHVHTQDLAIAAATQLDSQQAEERQQLEQLVSQVTIQSFLAECSLLIR